MTRRWPLLVKLLAYAPGVVISTWLTVTAGSLLPPPYGLVFTLALVGTALLAAGVSETTAVRVRYAGRRPTPPEESALLAPALALLAEHGVGPHTFTIRVRYQHPAVAVRGVGRRTLLVSGGLVAATRAGRLTPEQAAALMLHAAAPTAAGLTRYDLALGFWTIPYQAARAVAHAVIAAITTLPLTGPAWRYRFIIGGTAVHQAIDAGHPYVAMAVTAVVALSYLIPRWERTWLALLDDIGDAAVRDAGLGAALADALRSSAPSRAELDRVHALTDPRPTGPDPQPSRAGRHLASTSGTG